MKSILVVSAVTVVVVAFAAIVIGSGRTRALAADDAQPLTKESTMSKSVSADTVGHVEHTDAEWRDLLTPEQYRVLRQHGTEMAFTGKYWNNHADGTYLCAACGLELFRSDEKFNSGTGWPSFWAPEDPTHVRVNRDTSLGMVREELVCARCGGHLGHVFDDGPKPTGLRYCINSAALRFEKAGK